MNDKSPLRLNCRYKQTLKVMFFLLSILLSGRLIGGEEYSEPAYGPDEIVELAKPYLSEKWKFNLDEWQLVKLSFNYFGHFKENGPRYKSGWVISYKDKNSGINLSIWASNEKLPYFMVLQ